MTLEMVWEKAAALHYKPQVVITMREQEGVRIEKEQLNHPLVLFIFHIAAYHQNDQNHY